MPFGKIVFLLKNC